MDSDGGKLVEMLEGEGGDGREIRLCCPTAGGGVDTVAVVGQEENGETGVWRKISHTCSAISGGEC